LSDNALKPYWASVDSGEIANNILDKVEKYFDYCEESGRLDMWRRSWLYYYRPRITGGMIQTAGQQGELTTVSVNHFRNLLSHLEIMTTEQKANFQPQAMNSDKKAQSQVILAASLLDYYMKEKKLSRNLQQAVKASLIFGEGFLRAEWDATAGEVRGARPEGGAQYTGDMVYTNYNPFNVIRDYTKQKNTKKDWRILRDFKSKHDLAAKFPDLSEDILSDSPDQRELFRSTVVNLMDFDESDLIPTYTLLHPPTPAMPQGRYTECLDNGTVLMDGPLPYEESHTYRIAPDEEDGTIFGYTVAFDLLPLQELLDMLHSTVASNQSAFGVQSILVPKGHDISVNQMTGGMNVVEYDPAIGKPESMELLSTPAEIFNYIDKVEHTMEILSGVNNVARGNVERDMSGAALALIQSMSIQFNSGLQKSYAELNEDTGTGTVKILQVYATVPRIGQIVGKSNRPKLKEWKNNDLDGISYVTVDMGNAMMNSPAGRTNLADKYMEMGAVDNPDQYQQVVTTGRLEPIIEGKQANLLYIKGENEGLADGIPQRVLITDDHAKHILEHTTVLANSEIRQNPNDPIVEATLAHIQEHLMLGQSPGYLAMAAALGHDIAIQPQMPPPSPPGNPGDGGTGDMMGATNPTMDAAAEVQQPNMPSPPAGADPNSAAIIEGQQTA
jgi:hypothetical protein